MNTHQGAETVTLDGVEVTRTQHYRADIKGFVAQLLEMSKYMTPEELEELAAKVHVDDFVKLQDIMVLQISKALYKRNHQ